MREIAGQHLGHGWVLPLSLTAHIVCREFPPRQKAASFTIDQVLEKLTSGVSAP